MLFFSIFLSITCVRTGFSQPAFRLPKAEGTEKTIHIQMRPDESLSYEYDNFSHGQAIWRAALLPSNKIIYRLPVELYDGTVTDYNWIDGGAPAVPWYQFQLRRDVMANRRFDRSNSAHSQCLVGGREYSEGGGG